jgi:hypothetical protein
MGICLFCRTRSKLTREHIWADWLKHYLPRDRLNHEHMSAVVLPRHTKREVKRISGDPRSRTLRCVCRDCNNGWMGRLQEKMKPTLVDLIEGARREFTPYELFVLRSWISMFVIVAEGMDRKRRSVPQDEIDFVFTNKGAPFNWRIWVAMIERRQWKTEYLHFVAPIGSGLEVQFPHGSDGEARLAFNTQTTTFTLGKVFFHVMSTGNRKAQFVRAWNFNLAKISGRLIEILPDPIAINWPLLPIGDREADFIAHDFMRYCSRLSPSR